MTDTPPSPVIDTEKVLAELLAKHVDILDTDSLVLWAVLRLFAAEIERLRRELEVARGTGPEPK